MIYMANNQNKKDETRVNDLFNSKQFTINASVKLDDEDLSSCCGDS